MRLKCVLPLLAGASLLQPVSPGIPSPSNPPSSDPSSSSRWPQLDQKPIEQSEKFAWSGQTFAWAGALLLSAFAGCLLAACLPNQQIACPEEGCLKMCRTKIGMRLHTSTAHPPKGQ